MIIFLNKQIAERTEQQACYHMMILGIVSSYYCITVYDI
ncbi:hypothetical protein GYO_4412 [Bacillus spizizenii TU-B-10]|uniref:Uncharacterized protein n=1 Tax=Bacillus spizizenii (strain DSM 15029 / JCM 12233 / NBRC 101239 / NRRL B-23049 / TU-B-10) TaxID=1052585 RepID=G4NZ06_BACS4|nr:hypothetical protein GYO_4412 [Bacillus spizizenii TU-B-10]